MMRIGTVSYTNAFPLIEFLPQVCPDAEIISVVPSKLGTLMSHGEVDVALLSSIELFKHPEYTYLPDISISSDGAVGSVLLFSLKPAHEIKTVALDQCSLTSVLLTKILFQEHWQINPEYIHYSPPVEHGLAVADAALAIGDAGLIAENLHPFCYDLGAEWKKMTGLPFVFALWIARPGFDTIRWQTAFLEAKEMGLSNLEPIVNKCTSVLPLPPARFYRYFQENLCYDLGEKELAGMKLYFEKAKHHLNFTKFGATNHV